MTNQKPSDSSYNKIDDECRCIRCLEKDKALKELECVKNHYLLISSIKAPIQTVSEANRKEHWAISNRRHRQQKQLVKIFFKELSKFKDRNITIKLCRISSRKLDSDDNLPMSFKYIKDAIADIIYPGQAAGRADDTKFIKWKYAQEKGIPKAKPSIQVEVYEFKIGNEDKNI